MKNLFITYVLLFSLISYSQNFELLDSIIEKDKITFIKNIDYGKKERNKLDLLIPNSKNKTPLVIYLHGGGYRGGKKENSYKRKNLELISKILNENIAYATINYSFLNNNDGLLSSLQDSKKALQFLKFNSKKYNIDKEKIIIWGVSSGANSALWLGLSDDMAEIGSNDLVSAESTIVQGIISISGAHSFNSDNWKRMIKMDDKIFDLMIKGFLKYPGVDVEKWLINYKDKKYQENIDYYNFMDPSDPPIFVANYGTLKPKNIFQFNHHPLHAKYLKQRADSLNIKNVVHAPAIGIVDKSNKGILEFIIDNLN
jgi:acetyl esterase/lipase|tara:strand:+ start:348 stop:1286 length:939 start_codon:yes stop_codon:yes gene_type:complete